MSKPWTDVEQSSQYQTLAPEEQQQAKKQYFDEIVTQKPEYQSLQPEEQQAASAQFLGQQKEELPDSIMKNMIGKGQNPIEATGSYIKEHPVKTALQGTMQTVTGKSAGDIGREMTAPKESMDLANPINSGAQVAKQTLAGTAGDIYDMVTTPANLVIGEGLNLAGKVLGPAAEWTASRINNSIIKPLSKDFMFGKDAGGVLAREVPVSKNLEEWKLNTQKTIDNKMKQVKDIVSKTSPDASVNVKADIDKLYDSAMGKAASTGNDSLLQQLVKDKDVLENKMSVGKDEFGNSVIKKSGSRDLSNLSAQDAIDLKKNIGDMPTNFSRDFGDINDIQKVRRQAYGILRGKIDKVVPGAAPLNEDIASLISAKNALSKQIGVEQRRSLIGSLPAVGGAGLIIHGGLSGNHKEMETGLAAITLGEAIRNPRIMGALAKGLSYMSDGGKIDLMKKFPWVAENYSKIMSSVGQAGENIAGAVKGTGESLGTAGKLGGDVVKPEEPLPQEDLTAMSSKGSTSPQPEGYKPPILDKSGEKPLTQDQKQLDAMSSESPAQKPVEPKARENVTDEKGQKWTWDGQRFKKLNVGAVGAGTVLASSNADAKSKGIIPDKDAILTILGEVGPYGKEGMQWVASTLRNRGTLSGAYGRNNPNVVNKKYTSQQYNDAKKAWEESKGKDFTNGASNWFSDADLKSNKVQNLIKKGNLMFIKRVGRNNFYKRSSK